jgi:hypothetical protein
VKSASSGNKKLPPNTVLGSWTGGKFDTVKDGIRGDFPLVLSSNTKVYCKTRKEVTGALRR